MVCAWLLLGTGGEKVAALFRAIGAHYHDHFSLVILPRFCYNDRDPDCKVGSLYPVSGIRMVTFRGKYPQLVRKASFSASQGKFCLAEFSIRHKLWEQEVRKNDSVMKLMTATETSLNWMCLLLLYIARNAMNRSWRVCHLERLLQPMRSL